MSLAPPSSHARHPPTQADASFSAAPSSGAARADTRVSCVNSEEILKGEKAVAIHHNGSTYRLQATRLGKLILTK